MRVLADSQPFWENGASMFWVVIAIGLAVTWIVEARK